MKTFFPDRPLKQTALEVGKGREFVRFPKQFDQVVSVIDNENSRIKLITSQTEPNIQVYSE